jgi:hypothetical protein
MRRANRHAGEEATHYAGTLLQRLTDLVALQKQLLSDMARDEQHGACAWMESRAAGLMS